VALADDQAAFARTATRGDGLYGRLLEAKRRSELAACMPELAQALGSRFIPAFAAWWRASAHDHADFRAALLDAARVLLHEVPRARRPAVRREILRWELAGPGPIVRLDGDEVLWFRLFRGSPLRGWRISPRASGARC
jgi:hypothetical protein